MVSGSNWQQWVPTRLCRLTRLFGKCLLGSQSPPRVGNQTDTFSFVFIKLFCWLIFYLPHRNILTRLNHSQIYADWTNIPISNQIFQYTKLGSLIYSACKLVPLSNKSNIWIEQRVLPNLKSIVQHKHTMNKLTENFQHINNINWKNICHISKLCKIKYANLPSKSSERPIYKIPFCTQKKKNNCNVPWCVTTLSLNLRFGPRSKGGTNKFRLQHKAFHGLAKPNGMQQHPNKEN